MAALGAGCPPENRLRRNTGKETTPESRAGRSVNHATWRVTPRRVSRPSWNVPPVAVCTNMADRLGAAEAVAVVSPSATTAAASAGAAAAASKLARRHPEVGRFTGRPPVGPDWALRYGPKTCQLPRMAEPPVTLPGPCLQV